MKRLIVAMLLVLAFVGYIGLTSSWALPATGSSGDKDSSNSAPPSSSYGTPPGSSDATTHNYFDYHTETEYPLYPP